MKDVQCYELFGGIALKNRAFSFFFNVLGYYSVPAISVSGGLLRSVPHPFLIMCKMPLSIIIDSHFDTYISYADDLQLHILSLTKYLCHLLI